MTTDDSIHEFTGAYALDALTEDDRAEFERHLQDCDACTTEVAGLVATVGRLALVTEQAPPAHLRSAVLGEIRRTRQTSPVVVDIRARSGRSGRRLVAVAGAFLAAAAAAVVVVVNLDSPPSADDIRAAADVQQYESPVIEGGRAVLLVSDEQDAAVITFSGLAEPVAGAAYQLWVIEDGVPRPVEDQFEPAADGTASVVVDDIPSDFTLAMTRETDPEPTVPAPPIMVEIPRADA